MLFSRYLDKKIAKYVNKTKIEQVSIHLSKEKINQSTLRNEEKRFVMKFASSFIVILSLSYNVDLH